MSSMMTTSERVEVVDDVVEGPEVVDDDVAKKAHGNNLRLRRRHLFAVSHMTSSFVAEVGLGWPMKVVSRVLRIIYARWTLRGS